MFVCFFPYPDDTPLYVNWHYLNSCSNYIKLHCVSEQLFDVELFVFENIVEHTREEVMFMYAILCPIMSYYLPVESKHVSNFKVKVNSK